MNYKMNYKQLANDIIGLAGGIENLETFTNCMTRVRLTLKDRTKPDTAGIKALAGVMGVVEQEQYQIVVGPGHAQRLREAMEEVTGAMADSEIGGASAEESGDHFAEKSDGHLEEESGDHFEDVADATKAKMKAKQTGRFQKALKHVGNVFIPLIPGFVACGLVLAITNIWKLIDPEIAQNQWFLAFAAIGGLLNGVLHILVGYNASKEFGASPVIGAIIAAFIYSPALNGIPATGIAPAQQLSIPFFDIPITAGLGGVIGVIFAAYILSIIEKWLRKRVSPSLDLLFVPFLTIIIGAVLTLFIIMPVSAVIMEAVTYVLIDLALHRWGFIGGYILAASFLPLVMVGLHQGLIPVHAQLIAETGHTALLPILACAGAGQVGMALAIYVKTRNKNLRGRIANALPVGFLGIGEPLIYGVSLPLFHPFITACLGAGFGGMLIGYVTSTIGEVGATAIGPSGLILLPLIDNGMWMWYLAGLVASYMGGFVLTYFFGYNESMLERLK